MINELETHCTRCGRENLISNVKVAGYETDGRPIYKVTTKCPNYRWWIEWFSMKHHKETYRVNGDGVWQAWVGRSGPYDAQIGHCIRTFFDPFSKSPQAKLDTQIKSYREDKLVQGEIIVGMNMTSIF